MKWGNYLRARWQCLITFSAVCCSFILLLLLHTHTHTDRDVCTVFSFIVRQSQQHHEEKSRPQRDPFTVSSSSSSVDCGWGSSGGGGGVDPPVFSSCCFILPYLRFNLFSKVCLCACVCMFSMSAVLRVLCVAFAIATLSRDRMNFHVARYLTLWANCGAANLIANKNRNSSNKASAYVDPVRQAARVLRTVNRLPGCWSCVVLPDCCTTHTINRLPGWWSCVVVPESSLRLHIKLNIFCV